MSAEGALKVSPSLVTGAAILAIGVSIAAMAGFDAVFNAATLGDPSRRVNVFLAIAVIGLLCASHADLHLLPRAKRLNIAMPVAIALAMAGAVILVDVLLFRSVVPQDYVAFVKEQPPGVRILYFLARAFNEEMLYRLFLMSTIVCGIGLWYRDDSGDIPDRAYWFAIIAAQTIAILINVIAPLPFADLTPTFALYALIRFIAPGIVWGFLYWRYGLVTAQVAHIGTHIILQPALGYLL